MGLVNQEQNAFVEIVGMVVFLVGVTALAQAHWTLASVSIVVSLVCVEYLPLYRTVQSLTSSPR